MVITVPSDGGNIEVVSVEGQVAELLIRKDTAADFSQWFHFRVDGKAGDEVELRITNAGTTSYPKGWEGYRAAASYDQDSWFRIPGTTYEDGVLTIRHELDEGPLHVAYFAPYSLDRHAELIGSASRVDGVEHTLLGVSVEGRPIDKLTVGSGEKVVWVIARQHPGETMAEWWVEGFLTRLLDPYDALARKLLAQATFHVVPNMNPDGGFLGNLRTNAAGANLNREWHAPTMERSPEVKLVLDDMDRTGVDLCLDVHGDEELPYNFVSGAEGIDGWTDTMASLQAKFLAAYERCNPDFQSVYGYGVDEPGQANLTMCTNQVAARFSCLAMTLEQPFKDAANHPLPSVGWNPERAQRLGASVLEPMAVVLEAP